MSITLALSVTILLMVSLPFGRGQDDDLNPRITIAQGTLFGEKIIREKTGNYYDFLGIPYAKAPVGDLRFKAPVPPEPWNGTLDCTLENQMCLQPDSMEFEDGIILGFEDCLFVNVYIPQLPDPDNLLPVMVWIHGGGFLTGNGNYYQQGPEYILEQGVIYVSFNYRLGVMGFLTTEDEAAPGNVGMKDQVMALQWVQDNIAAFGGDPKKVTIFGESAGSASVHYHMLSPMSEGLFRGAIAQSGSPVSAWAVALEPRKSAFQLGNALGFSGNSSQDLVEFLRGIDEYKLLGAARSTFPDWDKLRITQEVFYVPSVEPALEGETQFLPDYPVNLFNQGKFKDVPFITGITSAEGIYFYFASGIPRGSRTFEELDASFDQTFKPDLRYCREEDCGDEMLGQIRKYYFGDQPVNNDTVNNLIELLSDLYFTEGEIYGIKKMSAQNTSPIYFYLFSYDGDLGFIKTQIGLSGIEGVSHADDLGYIFDVGLDAPENSTAIDMRSKTIKLWTNFVKTGNPTPEATEDIPIWQPYTSSTPYYLEINLEMSLKSNLYQERYDFWQNLYKPYANSTPS